MQRVAAQRQGVPFLDNDAAVGVVGAEVGLHHIERLRRGNDGCLRVGLRKGIHRAGVVRLHMLHNEVIGCALAQRGGNLGNPLIGEVGVHTVHNRDLVIANQVRIVRHTVGNVILALE